MTILAKINGVAFIPYPVKLNLKMFFDMAKITKSNPVSKRNGVEKIIMPHYQLFTNFNLTAMPYWVKEQIVKKNHPKGKGRAGATGLHPWLL